MRWSFHEIVNCFQFLHIQEREKKVTWERSYFSTRFLATVTLVFDSGIVQNSGAPTEMLSLNSNFTHLACCQNAAQHVDYGPTNQCSRIVGLCMPVIKKCAITSFAYLMRGREMSCFSRVERWKCQPETKVLWCYWWSSGWDSVLPM